MDQIIKQNWMAALRSSEYEQGHGALKDGSKYCCLAVLATICNLTISPENKANDIIIDGKKVGYKPIKDIVQDDEIVSKLWKMNDGIRTKEHTFPEIADFIDKNL